MHQQGPVFGHALNGNGLLMVCAFLIPSSSFYTSEGNEEDGQKEEEEEEEEEEEPVEDLLKPGHLTHLLEEELSAEVDALSLGEVTSELTQLLDRLRTHRDSCQPHQLQVGARSTNPGICIYCIYTQVSMYIRYVCTLTYNSGRLSRFKSPFKKYFYWRDLVLVLVLLTLISFPEVLSCVPVWFCVGSI